MLLMLLGAPAASSSLDELDEHRLIVMVLAACVRGVRR
jgi:hypothetical protein